MPKSVEQLYRTPAEFPVDSGMETLNILQALDVNPQLAKKFLDIEGEIIEGEYSYTLTLHSKMGERSKIKLSLEPLDEDDIFEDEWLLTDKRVRGVQRRWGDEATLLRFGELYVTNAEFIEKRGSELSSLSGIVLHAILKTHGKGREDNLGFI